MLANRMHAIAYRIFFDEEKWVIYFTIGTWNQKKVKNKSWPRYYGYVNRIESRCWRKLQMFVIVGAVIMIAIVSNACPGSKLNLLHLAWQSQESVCCCCFILCSIDEIHMSNGKINKNSIENGHQFEWYIDIAPAIYHAKKGSDASILCVF